VLYIHKMKEKINKNLGQGLWLKKGLLETNGSLYYDETLQAWGIIRLRKEIIQELPKLKDKRSRFLYKMMHYFTHDELLDKIIELKKKKEPLPVLLFFYENKKLDFD